MTIMSILPIEADRDGPSFRAVAGERQSTGRTMGEALDALAAQLSDQETATFLVVRERRADRFFDEADQARLAELMDRWRSARDSGTDFSTWDQAELDRLVEAEVRATEARAASLASALGR
jgi:hypothetical protein